MKSLRGKKSYLGFLYCVVALFMFLIGNFNAFFGCLQREYVKNVKAESNESVTVISGLCIGEWASSVSNETSLYINATSLNVPTTIVNWIWTGANGGLSELGTSMQYNGGTANALSVYGISSDCFVVTQMAATEGTTVTILGNKIFTVDGVEYAFDQDYSFIYTNGSWEEFVQETATIIRDITIGTWAASVSNQTSLYLNVASGNVPTTIINWIWTRADNGLSEFGTNVRYNNGSGATLSVYGVASDCFVVTQMSAIEGTTIVIPGNKVFTVDNEEYIFDKTYSFIYTDGFWTETDVLVTYAYFSPENTNDYAAYVAAGFDTLWLDTEVYCYFTPFQTISQAISVANNFESSTLKTKMDTAFEVGIEKVIVYDQRLRLLSSCDADLICTDGTPELIGIFTEEGVFMGSQIQTEKLTGENGLYTQYNGKSIADSLYQFENETILKNYIEACLSAYKDHLAFYGVFLVDEPSAAQYNQVGLITKLIQEVCPEAYAQSCQLPALSTDVSVWRNSIKAYLEACGGKGMVNTFSYDHYPFYEINGNTTYEFSNYIAAMQVAAEIAKEYACEWELVMQTFDKAGYEINEACVRWQANLAVAFDAAKLASYTYRQFENDADSQCIVNDTALRGWVATANTNAKYMTSEMTGYEYQGSKTYNATQTYLYNRLTEISFSTSFISGILASGNDLLVNEFVNANEKLGYAFVNASNPMAGGNSITVTINMTQETVVSFVKNGVTERRTFTAGANTFVLEVGEIVFIK